MGLMHALSLDLGFEWTLLLCLFSPILFGLCLVVGIQGLGEFGLGVWDLEFGGIFCHGCMNVAVFE